MNINGVIIYLVASLTKYINHAIYDMIQGILLY